MRAFQLSLPFYVLVPRPEGPHYQLYLEWPEARPDDKAVESFVEAFNTQLKASTSLTKKQATVVTWAHCNGKYAPGKL